jgi:hypothetical protein
MSWKNLWAAFQEMEREKKPKGLLGGTYTDGVCGCLVWNLYGPSSYEGSSQARLYSLAAEGEAERFMSWLDAKGITPDEIIEAEHANDEFRTFYQTNEVTADRLAYMREWIRVRALR